MQAQPQQDCAGNTVTYEPHNAIDGQNNTAWRVPGNGQGQWIELAYPRSVEVGEIGIIPGYDKYDPVCDIDRFLQLRVVHRALVRFSDDTVKVAVFDRSRSMQWIRLDSPKTTKMVRIEVEDAYPPGDNPVDETAISEIEVRGQP